MLIDFLKRFSLVCFAPDDDGTGGGGEDNGEGAENDPAPDDQEKEESVKVEVDEKEYKSLQEFKEKAGEDFDAEKWGKLKGFDPAKVVENMEFGNAVEKDALLQAILTERIQAQREGRKVNLSKILKNFDKEIDGIESEPKGKQKEVAPAADPRVEELYKEKILREANDEQTKFDGQFTKTITDMKLDLDDFEKNLLKSAVEFAYIQKIKSDARYRPEYSEIKNIIKEAFKPIEAYRKSILSKYNKEITEGADESPDGVSGDGSINLGKKYDARKATPEERHEAMAAELRSKGYGT